MIKFGLDTPFDTTFQKTINNCLNNHLPACQTSIPLHTNIVDLFTTKKIFDTNSSFYTCFHSNITYNLAGSAKGSSDPQYGRKLTQTKNGLLRELDIATFLEKGVVVHVGTQQNEKVGINQIINTINEVLILENSNTLSYTYHSGKGIRDFKDRRKIILENSAAKGNQLGYSLDQISIILSQINHTLRDNVTICIDTCHLNDAAQYNLGDIDAVDKFYKDFDEKIGISKLEVFHMNDSKNKFGSKSDRHEHLSKGFIFGENEKGLKYFMNKTNQLNIPMIGEFNDGLGMSDIELVKNLFNQN